MWYICLKHPHPKPCQYLGPYNAKRAALDAWYKTSLPADVQASIVWFEIGPGTPSASDRPPRNASGRVCVPAESIPMADCPYCNEVGFYVDQLILHCKEEHPDKKVDVSYFT